MDSKGYLICSPFIVFQFGFYGPIAFDVAKVMANLLLTVFATYGLEGQTSRAGQRGETEGTEKGSEHNHLCAWISTFLDKYDLK